MRIWSVNIVEFNLVEIYISKSSCLFQTMFREPHKEIYVPSKEEKYICDGTIAEKYKI